MQSSHADTATNFYEVAGNIRTGDRTVKALLTGREGSPDNYKLAYSYGEESSDWATPRHRHAFEQVRHRQQHPNPREQTLRRVLLAVLHLPATQTRVWHLC